MKKNYLLLAVLGLISSNNLFGQSNVHKQDSLRTVELEEVSVLATKMNKTTPMTYTTIKKGEISKSNLGQDMPFLLQMQPSVVVSSEAGTGLGYTYMRVRGVETRGINIMVNGVPLNDSESQGVFWVNMADFAGSTEELQLQRGVGSSTNGAGAFGASLNMRTDKLSNKAYTELNLGYGSYNTQKQTLRLGSGLLNKHWAVDARVSRIKSDGYVDRATFDGLGYFVQGGYVGNKTMVKLVSFGGKEKTGIAWNGISPEEEMLYGKTFNPAGLISMDKKTKQGKYHHNTDNYRQIHNQLVVSHKFDNGVSLNFTGHYTNGYGYTDEYKHAKLKKYGLSAYTDAQGNKVKKSDLIRRKYLDNNFYGGILTSSWKNAKWQINFGLSANHYVGDHYGEISWIKSYPKSIDPKARYYDDTAHKTELSSFLKLNYKLTSKLSTYFDAQVRSIGYQIEGSTDNYDDNTNKLQVMDLDTDFLFFNPKFGLFYEFNRHHEAYASLAVAHREPNRKTYTDASNTNKYPEVERLLDYELGYNYKSRRLSASANFYYMDYHNQFVYNGKFSNVGEPLVENVPDSYRMGLELSGSYQMTDWLRLDASATFSKNKIKEYKYFGYDWSTYKEYSFSKKDVDIAYSPQITASGALTFSKWGFEASLRENFVSKQYLDNRQVEDCSLPAYSVTSLLLGYQIPIKKFVKEWRISLQVNNLFNQSYYNLGYGWLNEVNDTKEVTGKVRFPQAPINFLVGTSIRF